MKCISIFLGILILAAGSFYCGSVYRAAYGVPASGTLAASNTVTTQATPVPTVRPPSPPTVNDVLIANNNTVQQISAMYKDFGIIITLIVSLVGVGLTCMGLAVKKGIQEFTDTWKTKFEELETETKDAQDSFKSDIEKAKEASDQARESEQKARSSLDKIDGYKSVIEETLRRLEEQEAKALGKEIVEEKQEAPTVEPDKTEEQELEELTGNLRNKLPNEQKEGNNG